MILEIKKKHFIILSLSLYFGWLLSFPLYGPVLYNATPIAEYNGVSLVLIFISFHCLSYLTGGMVLKNINLWYKLTLGSIIITMGANMALLLPFTWVWPFSMAVMGICSALYVLGWSCVYSLAALPIRDKFKIMAGIMILSNLVFVLYNLLSNILPTQFLLLVACIPLAGALLFLIYSPYKPSQELYPFKRPLPLPKPLLIIFCFLIFALYLNGGFMYRIMLPTMDVESTFFTYYQFIPYIFTLLVLSKFGEGLKRYFFLYIGVSLLGLSFISFALLNNITAGYLITTGLVGAAFALLDLFVWTTLGILAFIYKAPYSFFGLTLAAKIASIICGDLIGEQLLSMGQTHLVTALLAATSIFLAFTVVPWLNQQIEENLFRVLKSEDPAPGQTENNPFNRLEHFILSGQKLTPREIEITRLILQGLTNHAIAHELFISINTLKTHLKHIYCKFGVSQKTELLSLAVRKVEKLHCINNHK